MGPRFSSFLKRQRNSAGASADPLNSLAAQSIALCQDAIEENDVVLYWDRLEEKTFLVPVGLIEGLREGAPKIAATRLCEIAPLLFDTAPAGGAAIILRLSWVVSQLANLLPEAPEPPEIVNQSFETPFSRQAEEERARLSQRKNPAPAHATDKNHSPPGQTAAEEAQYEPSDRPTTPLELLREYDFPRGAPTEKEGAPGPPNAGSEAPKQPSSPSAAPRESAPAPAIQAEREKVSVLPTLLNRRAAMERLQELFLLEEDLDGPRVAEEILKLPRIQGALVIRGQAVLGGRLPEPYDPRVALSAPELIEQLAQFTAALGGGTFSLVTISASQEITLVVQGAITVVVIHQGRFVPGVREKLVQTAKALDDFYTFES
jgi:hypothetical protein